MRLYVLPGACSLASHIALEVVQGHAPPGLFKFDVVVLERGRNQDHEFTAVNPLGTVPALVTRDGRLIVESLAVLLHIAEAHPEAAIIPPQATAERDRVLTLLSAMVTTGHSAFQMLWRSERFADNDLAQESVQRMSEHRLRGLFERLEQEIGNSGHLVHDQFTIADMYLFVLARWGLRLSHPTTCYPRLWQYTQRVAHLEPVQRAMARERIALEGPARGPG